MNGSAALEGQVSEFERCFSAGYQHQCAGRYHRAVKEYQRAIAIRPNCASALNNFGNTLRSLGLPEKALGLYDKALTLRPQKQSCLLNKSLALLALNRYEEAWPLYESRLRAIDYRREVLTSGKPKWDGRRLKQGERLFIYSNQGIGDELQAFRYVPMVADRVDQIYWEVHRENYTLFEKTEGITKVLARSEDGASGLLEFDYHVEIFSLPGVFGTHFDTVPSVVRPSFDRQSLVYDRIQSNRERFPECMHVGLAWSGNPANDLNRFRACGLIHCLPFLQLQGHRFYSLQKGAPRNDIEEYKSELNGNLLDLSEDLVDMRSTATAIDSLDLVITTDTSVPHLAGTLGAETWVMVHRPSDWRWTLEEEVTPWYPKVRLFRQDTARHWGALVEQVVDALLGHRQ